MIADSQLLKTLKSKKGSAVVEFLPTVTMLVLTFAMLLLALVYVTQFYNASYICRRVVRTIEVTGEYDEAAIHSLTDSLGGNALEGLRISVSGPFRSGNRIQLRDEFQVVLRAKYSIDILTFGSRTVKVDLPIEIKLSGRSEVYWK